MTLVCVAVSVAQSIAKVSVKNAVISGGRVSTTSGTGTNNGQPLISVTLSGYVPSVSPVKHHCPPPLPTHPAPIGNGFVPPVMVIQIEPLSNAHAGTVSQLGCMTTVSTISIGSG